jgi:hypothetical protein
MGLSDMTIMGIAGHVSRDMLEHYSHIRLDAKRQALEGLDAPIVAVAQQSEATRPSIEGVMSQSTSQTGILGRERLGKLLKVWSGR